ncbi:autotransporter assembly complex family protein [Thiospirillum jenense]|uniref:autotransporter assembly complex protein TamA n=1 Tax=Thiospirillum jenense TaxID=1653858 RepID=UPI0030B823ED
MNTLRRWQGLCFIITTLMLPGVAWALSLEVRVTGVENELEQNVLALLTIYQERRESELTLERLQYLHRRAPEQITTALAPFGYYQVQVAAHLQPDNAHSEQWNADYQIVLGEPVKIAAVNYHITGDGATNPHFPAQFPLRVGDVLRHSEYTAGRAELERIAASEGYLDAELLQHAVLVDPIANTATVNIELATGPRYYLGAVRFQQALLKPKFLQRFVPFKPGAVYDPGQLLTLQSRLLGSEYFDRVEIKPLKDQAGAQRIVPIDVIAHPNKANKYRVGLGMATDIGPRLTLDYRRRYLWQSGHQLKTEMMVAAALQTWESEYRIPIRNPLQDYLLIRPELTLQDTTARSGSAFRLQAAHSVRIRNGWRRTIGLDYRYENYTITDSSAENDSDQFNGLVPSIAWSKVVADDPVNTRNGYRLKALLQGTTPSLFAPTTWLSMTANAKWIKTISDNYRLISRADVGAVFADELADVPASQRFFAGGDNSVRGFGFEALGPNDPITDASIGGRYLTVGSFELERELNNAGANMSMAAFTDFGNAFDPDYPSEWHHSVGVGLRYSTPIGRIRFDLAYALTKTEPGVRLHVLIGPDL